MKREVSLFRHSKSSYSSTREIVEGQNAEKPIDYEDQKTPDLTSEGIGLAKQEAEKFFADLDPQKDELFFVSSNEVRAIETANIFRQIAKEKGFNIIKTEHSRNNLAEKLGEGEIRIINTISLNLENSLLSIIYNPNPEKIFNINWEGVREETKEKWQEARKIIENDNRGSWAANYASHSQKIGDILKDVSPNDKSAEDLFKKNFRNILRLVRFAKEKIEKEEGEKNIKVLGFGHENYLLVALKQYFDEQGIDYCESINFELTDKGVLAGFRGKETIID